MAEDKLIYRSAIPRFFYVFRILSLLALILFLIWEVNYIVLLVYSAGVVYFSLNRLDYILEVHDDHFKVILPCCYGKQFFIYQTFFYKDIHSLELRTPKSNPILSGLNKLFNYSMPALLNRFVFSSQNPSISFYDQHGEKKSFQFTYNNPTLDKALRSVRQAPGE